MKNFVFALFILLSCSIDAQPFKTETSEAFVGDLGFPVLAMSDGSTIFQEDNEKQRKMYLTIFDKNHKIIVNRKEMNFKKINYTFRFSYQQSTKVKFWMEFGGKAKVYFENELKPYYVIINPKNGEIEEETEIQDVELGNTTNVNGRTIRHTYVIKSEIDFVTGNRLKIDRTWKTLNKKEALAKTDFNDVATLSFKFFNSQDKEIQNVDFDFLNKKYQAITIMQYHFENNVLYFVSKMYKITDRASYDAPMTGKGEVGVVVFSKYDLTTKKFTHKELYDLREDVVFENCNMKFGPDGKTCFIAFFAKTGKDKVKGEYKYIYEIFFQNIDIQTFEIEKPFSIANGALHNYLKTECKISEGYTGGFLQDFFIDAQNNLVAVQVKNASFSGSSVHSYNPDIFGYTYYDKKGVELGANIYQYNVKDVNGESYVNNKTVYSKNNFKYKYIMTPKGVYFLGNNLDENFNLPKNEKAKECKAVDETNTMLVNLNKSEVKEYYLFGKPDDKNKTMHTNFRNVFYDEKSQTFIATVFEGKGFENTRAVWVKLD